VSQSGRLGRERGRGWRAAPASCRALGQRKGSALDQGRRKEKGKKKEGKERKKGKRKKRKEKIGTRKNRKTKRKEIGKSLEN
jgi:hypothetical protein